MTSAARLAAGAAAAASSAGCAVRSANSALPGPDNRARTADGFQTTFATNHLALYLLLRLLLPRVADGGRVVITTSDTHDPAEKTGVPPPRHADAHRLAHPETHPEAGRGPAAAMRAYSTSKLCNVLTARALAARPETAARHLTVIAYNPGLTPGTGLVRTQPWVVRAIVWPLLPLFKPFVGFMNSLDDAGEALAALSSDVVPPPGRLYASLRKGIITWPDPSDLARDDAVMARLWNDSAALVGTTP